jgi:hypothetical protein
MIFLQDISHDSDVMIELLSLVGTGRSEFELARKRRMECTDDGSCIGKFAEVWQGNSITLTFLLFLALFLQTIDTYNREMGI